VLLAELGLRDRALPDHAEEAVLAVEGFRE
jgi:hypothetical protein